MLGGSFVDPEKCPGHRFPRGANFRNKKPGEPIACVWCGYVKGYKSDPRNDVGARFLGRWQPPRGF